MTSLEYTQINELVQGEDLHVQGNIQRLQLVNKFVVGCGGGGGCVNLFSVQL